MILYFTGTGNSRYAAETLGKYCKDEVVSINEKMKSGDRNALLSESKPFVFVCPTYAWRLPVVAEEWIRQTKFEGSRDVYFVMTCGSDADGAVAKIQALCREKNWNLKGFQALRMPDNYVTLYEVCSKEKAYAVLAAAEAVLLEIGNSIAAGKPLSGRQRAGILGKAKSGFINKIFYSLFVRAKGFHATEKCTACGHCAALCPLNNIVLQNGKPVWGERCTHCMACIAGCPSEAVEYKNKTQGRRRYYFHKA